MLGGKRSLKLYYAVCPAHLFKCILPGRLLISRRTRRPWISEVFFPASGMPLRYRPSRQMCRRTPLRGISTIIG